MSLYEHKLGTVLVIKFVSTKPKITVSKPYVLAVTLSLRHFALNCALAYQSHLSKPLSGNLPQSHVLVSVAVLESRFRNDCAQSRSGRQSLFSIINAA